MRHSITIILCIAVMLSAASAVYAAPQIDLENGVNADFDIDTSESGIDTPIYGYIGPDAIITDPNPQNPDAPFVVEKSTTDMEISVPVKLMWAAFASGGGEIISPEYSIENKSAFAVDVTLTSFEQTSSQDDKDAGVELTLSGLASSPSGVGAQDIPAGTLDAAGGAQAKRTFGFEGSYEGSFKSEYAPVYKMVLTFEIH